MNSSHLSMNKHENVLTIDTYSHYSKIIKCSHVFSSISFNLILVHSEVGGDSFKLKDIPKLSDFIVKKLKDFILKKFVSPNCHR